MKSVCSLSCGCAWCWSEAESTTSCHQTSRSSSHSTSMPVRCTTRTLLAVVPGTAWSTAALSGSRREAQYGIERTAGAATIHSAIATIIRFSVSEMKPSGTLLSPPTHARSPMPRARPARDESFSSGLGLGISVSHEKPQRASQRPASEVQHGRTPFQRTGPTASRIHRVHGMPSLATVDRIAINDVLE